MRHTSADSVTSGGPPAPLGEVGGSAILLPPPAIEAVAAEKRFGERRALSPLTFVVPAESVLVVTGGNGSGKTTLLRLIAGLAVPTSGQLITRVARGTIGYLGHEPLLYREMTPEENLELFARLYRVPHRAARIDALLGRYGLRDVRRERVSSFSRGMVQRVALCRALLHSPRLLVLDEPHTALDADGASLLDAELAALSGTTTVVIATHNPERLAVLGGAQLRLAVA